MIRFHEAQNQIHEVALKRQDSLKSERIFLLDGIGRISAKEVLAPENMPAFDNSAMDGFAIKSHESNLASPQNPISFKVENIIAAGERLAKPTSQSMLTYEIMTGAPFPDGFDACVRIEDCKVIRDHSGRAKQITITEILNSGQNLRPAGGDFNLGARLLAKGEMLRDEHLLALASFGIVELEVFSKLKIALIATGKELVNFDQTPGPGQIRNSTQPYLENVIKKMNAIVESFLLKEDHPAEFTKLVENLSQNHFDMIISTGAVSMGQFDFVAPALMAMKAKIFFHKVAIRPGKPILFAEIPNGPVIFSLPGNPVSSVVGLRFFVEHYFSSLFYRPVEKPMLAYLSHDYEKPKDLMCFLKARLDQTKELPAIEILEGQMSSMLSSLLKSNVWAIIEDGISNLKAQSLVHFLPIHTDHYQRIDR